MTTGCTVVKELAGIQLLLHAVLCKELREKEPHLLPMDTQGNCEGQQEFLPVLPPAPQCCTGTPVSALNRKSAFQLIVLSPWAIGNCLCVEWVCMECCVWSRFVWRGVCGVVCVEWCVCEVCVWSGVCGVYLWSGCVWNVCGVVRSIWKPLSHSGEHEMEAKPRDHSSNKVSERARGK